MPNILRSDWSQIINLNICGQKWNFVAILCSKSNFASKMHLLQIIPYATKELHPKIVMEMGYFCA